MIFVEKIFGDVTENAYDSRKWIYFSYFKFILIIIVYVFTFRSLISSLYVELGRLEQKECTKTYVRCSRWIIKFFKGFCNSWYNIQKSFIQFTISEIE